MEKNQKNLKNDMLVLFIIELILLVFNLIKNEIGLNLIINAIFTVLMFIGYTKAKEKAKVAGTIGLVTSILMMITILNLDIIDFLLGLFVFIHSLKYSKEFE